MAADRGLIPPALHVKRSALPADKAALVRNSCLGETARCCLTVACMLHRYVGYYLAGNESTRWDWMFLAGKWSLLLCIKTSCGSAAAWWNANIERNVASLPPWIIYCVVYSGFIWNHFLIKPQHVWQADEHHSLFKLTYLIRFQCILQLQESWLQTLWPSQKKKKKKDVTHLRLNTLWELIDALDQASSEINCWFFFFFPLNHLLAPPTSPLQKFR